MFSKRCKNSVYYIYEKNAESISETKSVFRTVVMS